jgi:hypothetical protein
MTLFGRGGEGMVVQDSVIKNDTRGTEVAKVSHDIKKFLLALFLYLGMFSKVIIVFGKNQNVISQRD